MLSNGKIIFMKHGKLLCFFFFVCLFVCFMWVPDQGLDITVFDTGTSNQTNCERLDTNDEVTQYRVPFC